MIIKLLLDVIYGVFWTLTIPINLPDLPNTVRVYISEALNYVGTGIGVLSNYTHITYLLSLFGIIAAIDVGLWLYKIVLFIIKKIPMLSIE